MVDPIPAAPIGQNPYTSYMDFILEVDLQALDAREVHVPFCKTLADGILLRLHQDTQTDNRAYISTWELQDGIEVLQALHKIC